MNIKGLLIGSAAALVTVSGARAADAVMAPEPEPVEYVRVCDAYGAGFFYIPGTETCLKISGHVWYQIGATSDDGVTDTPNYWGFAGGGWNKQVAARINFDARSETEWGTLRSYIRFQSEWNGVGDGAITADQAYIELGGLRMGYTESAWAETVDGFASYGSWSWGGMYYGYQQRALIQYNFSSNGLFGTLSLEDDALTGEGYMPDVVGVVGYQSNWGAIWAKAGYDESFDGFGASVGLHLNVPTTEGSNLRLVAWYADGDHAFGTSSPGYFANSEWSVLASYYHVFSPKLTGIVSFQYFGDIYVGGTNVSSGFDGYAAELALVWLPIENFEVRTEINYDKHEALDDSVTGFLRFTRLF